MCDNVRTGLRHLRPQKTVDPGPELAATKKVDGALTELLNQGAECHKRVNGAGIASRESQFPQGFPQRRGKAWMVLK